MKNIFLIALILFLSNLASGQSLTGNSLNLTDPDPTLVLNATSAGQYIDNDGTNRGWPGLQFKTFDVKNGPLVNKWDITYGARDNNLYFYNYSQTATQFHLDDNGNSFFPHGRLGIGIGTTTPTAMLQIKNPTNHLTALEIGPSGNSHSYFKIDRYIGKDGGIIFTENGSNQYQLVHNTTGNFDLYSYSKAGIVFSVQENTGNVGIGTTSPAEKLEVKGNMIIDAGNGGGLFLNTNSGVNIDFRFREAGVNKYNLGYIAANDAMSLYDNTAQAYRWYVASNGNMGIGTASPTEKLSVDGTVLAKKVRVSAAGSPDWPDYVFAPSYELRALSEVENYIKENQHLPEVPSAKDIEANGLDLGSMDATLLKKVEELTLYLIQESKEKDELKKENKDLKETLDNILKRLEKLEKK